MGSQELFDFNMGLEERIPASAVVVGLEEQSMLLIKVWKLEDVINSRIFLHFAKRVHTKWWLNKHNQKEEKTNIK